MPALFETENDLKEFNERHEKDKVKRNDIINNAVQYVSEKNDNLSVMLDKLVNQSTDLDNKLRIIEEEKEELAKLIKLQNHEIEKTKQFNVSA